MNTEIKETIKKMNYHLDQFELRHVEYLELKAKRIEGELCKQR